MIEIEQPAVKRVHKWDNLKVFLIVCVVYGHVPYYFAASGDIILRIQFWVYLFHMPAFILLAGMFSKRAIESKDYHRIASYAVLYLLMKIVIYISSTLANEGTDPDICKLFYEDEVPWFAISMIWWHVITILVSGVSPRFVFSASLIVALFSGYCLDVDSFLALQRTLIFFPFFYFGYAIEIERINKFVESRTVKIISVAVILISIIVSYLYYNQIAGWRALFRGCFNYYEIGNLMETDYHLGFCWRLIAYCLSFMIVFSLMAIAPKVKIPIITAGGKRTLAVFAFHTSVLTLVFNCDTIKAWVAGGHMAIHSAIVVGGIVFVTAVLFEFPLRKMMTIPKIE